ncbi:secretion/DNA translocation related TadE-like protein [Marmoricola sp. URHA0025 HA25]
MALTTARRRDDRGAAVVIAVGLVAVLVFVAAVSVGTVAIVLAHRRAQSAADLASLAAAAALQRGAEPCAAAALIAGRQRAAVTTCLVQGPTVLVATSVALPPLLGGRVLEARARAGPEPVRGPTPGATPGALR